MAELDAADFVLLVAPYFMILVSAACVATVVLLLRAVWALESVDQSLKQLPAVRAYWAGRRSST